MTTASLSLISVLSYLGSAFVIAKLSASVAHKHRFHVVLFVLTASALFSHALALHLHVYSDAGLNLGIFNLASLVALCIGALLALLLVWHPVNSLGVAVYPLAAIFVAIAQWFPSQRLLQEAPIPIQLHIALSIFSYSLLAIAVLQAIYLAIAHHRLKSHRPILNFLPPLTTMESLLFQLTAIAFVLLTASLVLGGFAIDDIGEQHLAHKIVFSVLAWGVFAVLLIGRWRYHWRGHRAVKYVCAGFALLAIGFFGSKIVLELILHRA
ncbi:MAG: cytochrome C assembly family protein [Gammaproteobacteria bacterium]